MGNDTNTTHQEVKKVRNIHLFFRPVALAIETVNSIDHISEQIRAQAETLAAIRNYQAAIKTQKEKIDRIEYLLKHGKISEKNRKNATELLPLLKQGLNEHQVKLQNAIDRRPPHMQAQLLRR